MLDYTFSKFRQKRQLWDRTIVTKISFIKIWLKQIACCLKTTDLVVHGWKSVCMIVMCLNFVTILRNLGTFQGSQVVLSDSRSHLRIKLLQTRKFGNSWYKKAMCCWNIINSAYRNVQHEHIYWTKLFNVKGLFFYKKVVSFSFITNGLSYVSSHYVDSQDAVWLWARLIIQLGYKTRPVTWHIQQVIQLLKAFGLMRIRAASLDYFCNRIIEVINRLIKTNSNNNKWVKSVNMGHRVSDNVVSDWCINVRSINRPILQDDIAIDSQHR